MTTKITGDNITDGSVTTDDLNAAAKSSGATDINAFNIGVLGFKIAVNEGLTIFNLVDGVVDEFNDESGIDTAENTTSPYDSSSDFYSNLDGPNPIPSPQAGLTQITSTGPGTFSNEPTTTVVKVFAIAGGGAAHRRLRQLHRRLFEARDVLVRLDRVVLHPFERVTNLRHV